MSLSFERLVGKQTRISLSQMRRKGQNGYWVSRKKWTRKTPFRSRISLQIFFAISRPKNAEINPNAIMRGQKSQGINEGERLALTAVDIIIPGRSGGIGEGGGGPCRAARQRHGVFQPWAG